MTLTIESEPNKTAKSVQFNPQVEVIPILDPAPLSIEREFIQIKPKEGLHPKLSPDPKNGLSQAMSTFRADPEPKILPSPTLKTGINLRTELKKLVRRRDFSQLSADSLVSELKSLISTYGSPDEPRGGPRSSIAPLATVASKEPLCVPRHIKEELAKGKVLDHIRKLPQGSPIIGFTAYIGSPLDGDMIIANPGVVNDWLAYIRTAVGRKVIDKGGGALTSAALSKLINITELPEGRHAFEVQYGTQTRSDCHAQSHRQFSWESENYPCLISSCKDPKHV